MIKITKLSIFLILITTMLSNCGSVQKAFDPQNKNTSEEFLVEKKSRLSIPPSFEELPIPSDKKADEQSQKKNIESLIKENNGNDENLKTDESNKDFEQSILDKIKKN